MSLQLAAQHMASKGRGPDTQLVHMAPQEVAGLHALAKAHGGSLTVNPETGLAEAGFLKSILPMVIGAGLSIASGGTLTPMMAAMMTGGGYGLATGSLEKGLMAGLGAYGGAGLAGGLMSAGAAGAGAGASSAVPVAATEGLAGAASQGVPVGAPIVDAANLSQTGTNLFGNPDLFGGTAGEMGAAYGYTPPPATAFAAAPAPVPPIQAQQAVQAAAPQTVTQVAPTTPTMSQNFDRAFGGFKNLGTEAGREAFMGNAASKGVEATGVGGGIGLLKSGYAAAMPMLMQDPEKQAEREKEYPEYYSFDAGRLAERSPSGNYFNPTLTRIPRQAAGGGLMSFDEGGPVRAVRPVEQDPYYAMSGQSGDAFKYLMGQGANPMTAVRAAKATPPPVATPAPITVPAQPNSGGLGDAAKTNVAPAMFAFDPITGQLRNMGPRPDLKVPDAPAVSTTMPIDYGSYGGDDTSPPPPAPDSISDMSDTISAARGGVLPRRMALGGIAALAQGGPSHLGDYSDGGRLLRGPGDGVSDSIPASIGDKRPARLADGEFVVPARIVSELGNGSTEAGARKLYAMMDRVQKARSKTTGKNRVAVNSRSEKMLPA